MTWQPFETRKEIEPPNIILVGDDYLENAILTLSGYCKKHVDCSGCKFDLKEYGCFLNENTIPPCDWTIPWKGEGE